MTVSCASLKGFTIPVTSGLEYILKLTYICEGWGRGERMLVLTSLTEAVTDDMINTIG